MKFLVTGAAGFIGSNIVDEIIRKKHEVIAIDNECANNEIFFWNKKASNHRISILDLHKIKNLFRGIDFVLHLAAESRITNAINKPSETYLTNVIGTENILKLSLENKVKRVVFSSTSSIYGLNKPPNSENNKEDCLNPYSISKYTAEKICFYYNKNFNLPVTVLRYFNVFGERAPSNGYYAPVSSIFLRQYRENKPLTVVGNGSNLRDFVYVGDVVKANLQFCLKKQSNKFNTIFNVGSATNISILKLAKIFNSKLEFLPKRIGEAKSTLANIDRIKNTINWKPKVKINSWILKNIKMKKNNTTK